MKKMRKRSLTLLEIMIVIFLIALIGGVIGFNMKGSLDKGKAFRTEQAMLQIEDALGLLLAQGETTQKAITDNLVNELSKAEFIKNPKELAKDGWGGAFVVTLDNENNVTVTSGTYDKYLNKKTPAAKTPPSE